VGSFELEFGRYGSDDDDRARFVLEAPGSNEDRVVGPTLELLDLGTGNEGKGPVGGAIEDRAGRGSELLDMLERLSCRVGGCVRLLCNFGAGEALSTRWPLFLPMPYTATHMSFAFPGAVARNQLIFRRGGLGVLDSEFFLVAASGLRQDRPGRGKQARCSGGRYLTFTPVLLCMNVCMRECVCACAIQTSWARICCGETAARSGSLPLDVSE
jgi:hypothetical protein